VAIDYEALHTMAEAFVRMAAACARDSALEAAEAQRSLGSRPSSSSSSSSSSSRSAHPSSSLVPLFSSLASLDRGERFRVAPEAAAPVPGRGAGDDAGGGMRPNTAWGDDGARPRQQQHQHHQRHHQQQQRAGGFGGGFQRRAGTFGPAGRSVRQPTVAVVREF